MTQEATDSYGLMAQIEACQVYCNAYGYSLQCIYQDEGVSGSSFDHRPGLNALLAQQDIEVVVVYDYNRISRNMAQVAAFLNNLEAKHIRVETIANGNDPSIAQSVRALIEEMQRIERQKIIDRMRYSKAAKKAQRKWQ